MGDDQEWLPLATLARGVHVPEASARRYLGHFSEFFQARRIGKVTVYHSSAGEILKRVSDLFGQGLGRPQVEELLAQEFRRTHDVEQAQDASSAARGDAVVTRHEDLAVIAQYMERQAAALEALTSQKAQIEALGRENAELRERMAKLEERLTALPETSNSGEDGPAVTEEPEKRGWWKFWRRG